MYNWPGYKVWGLSTIHAIYRAIIAKNNEKWIEDKDSANGQ